MKAIFLTIFLVLTIGCSYSQNPNTNLQNSEDISQNQQMFKLPSGREIKVNNVMRQDFPNGDSALVMNYETTIPIEDMENLRKEIDEIWSLFQKDVENAGLKAGIIRAAHFEGNGMIRDGKVYGFVFTKNDQGKWQLNENTKKKQ